MAEFIHQYGTEPKCYRALYRSRGPMGHSPEPGMWQAGAVAVSARGLS